MELDRMRWRTREMVAIDSTGGREGDLADFLVGELGREGGARRERAVAGGWRNLLVTTGDANPPILLNTHIDTVPQQYGPEEDAERIHGRGAGDATGVLAAMLAALVAALSSRLVEPVAVLRQRAETELGGAVPDLVVQWMESSASDPLTGIDSLAGHPTGTAGFNTDLPYFGWRPRRRDLVGPGSILRAHRDPVGRDRMRGAWIGKASQEEGAALYMRLVQAEHARSAEEAA